MEASKRREIMVILGMFGSIIREQNLNFGV
jgi:hypothetical protein